MLVLSTVTVLRMHPVEATWSGGALGGSGSSDGGGGMAAGHRHGVGDHQRAPQARRAHRRRGQARGGRGAEAEQ